MTPEEQAAIVTDLTTTSPTYYLPVTPRPVVLEVPATTLSEQTSIRFPYEDHVFAGEAALSLGDSITTARQRQGSDLLANGQSSFIHQWRGKYRPAWQSQNSTKGSGRGTLWGLQNLPRYIAHAKKARATSSRQDPRLLVIELGTNDARPRNHALLPRQTAQNSLALHRMAQAMLPNTTVVTSAPAVAREGFAKPGTPSHFYAPEYAVARIEACIATFEREGVPLWLPWDSFDQSPYDGEWQPPSEDFDYFDAIGHPPHAVHTLLAESLETFGQTLKPEHDRGDVWD